MLTEWGLRDLLEASELIVSELVTNAIQASADLGDPRTGLPVVILRIATDHSRVLIEVWDSVPGAPVAGYVGLDDESGRGLQLVEALADRWSWRAIPGWPGKVVWAELHSQ